MAETKESIKAGHNIKFKGGGDEVCFGTLREKVTKTGAWKVDDAVHPYYHLVAEEDILDVIGFGKFDFKTGKWSDEYNQYIDAEFEKAQKISDSLPPGVQKGALFSIGVADGMAWYVVTKVNKKTCDVEWRGFCADHYRDHYFGLGRKRVPLKDIEPYVRRGKARRSMFSKEEE